MAKPPVYDKVNKKELRKNRIAITRNGIKIKYRTSEHKCPIFHYYGIMYRYPQPGDMYLKNSDEYGWDYVVIAQHQHTKQQHPIVKVVD